MARPLRATESVSAEISRNLALELVRVTEAGALASARWMGRGDKNTADGAAVDAMRRALGMIPMDGVVVIGEGEKDEAPMLYIGEQIGTGGHSVVFKGNDERLSRPVCIKVFSGLGGESGVGRTSYEHFVQEAFALSRLTHPNTLRIYDFGHLGLKDVAGMPLQVCEYMNGGTLSQIIREQGKQSLPETVRIISAMCAALAEAHGLGIVHRDIKPQNILITKGDRVRIVDFGIARGPETAEMTAPGWVMGRPF